MGTVSWTPFCSDDTPLILNMMESYYLYDAIPFQKENAAFTLSRFLSTPSPGKGWIIRMDGEAVGYIIMTNGFSFEFGGSYQFIDEFFILERWRGNQLGTKTIAFVEEAARQEGCKSLHLEVEHENESAQTFYKKQAYKDHGRYLLSKDLLSI
jgi:GNAT superfamily N-acetyltransferase